MKDAGKVEAARTPWNKGRLIGPKLPLQPKHVWAIRTRLQLAEKVRDLALFNTAVDSKLAAAIWSLSALPMSLLTAMPSSARAFVRAKRNGR
jgi:hypothetical protein